MKPLPDYEELHRLFSYDPETGLLTTKVSRNNTKIGDEVGCLHSRGYRHVGINREKYKVHRIIFKMMTGRDPIQVDHINGVRSDNRWENLRECEVNENLCNRKSSTTNTSTGCKNISLTNYNTFDVKIECDKQIVYRNTFKTLEEAILARNEALKEHHGEFANYG